MGSTLPSHTGFAKQGALLRGKKIAFCHMEMHALVSGASTARKPVDLETKRTALAELVEEEANCYEVKIGSKCTEPFSSLISPVDVCYDESHNFYHLRSSKLDIHDLVKEQHQDSSGSSDNYM